MKLSEVCDLEKALESNRVEATIKAAISILLAAINDWPNPISKLENYEREVGDFIGDAPTKSKINLALAQIDFSKNAWQAESLSQLVTLFEFYDVGTSLKEIIVDLKTKLGIDGVAI